MTINRKIPVLYYFTLKCSEWWLGTGLANLKLWIIVIVVEGCCYCNSTEFRGKKKRFAWNHIAANLSSFSSSSDGMLYFLVELLLLDSHLALFEPLVSFFLCLSSSKYWVPSVYQSPFWAPRDAAVNKGNTKRTFMINLVGQDCFYRHISPFE